MKKAFTLLLLLPLFSFAQTKSYVYLTDGSAELFAGFEITIKRSGDKITAVESFTVYGKELKDLAIKNKKITVDDDQVTISFKAHGDNEYFFVWNDDDKELIRLYGKEGGGRNYWKMKLEKELDIAEPAKPKKGKN